MIYNMIIQIRKKKSNKNTIFTSSVFLMFIYYKIILFLFTIKPKSGLPRQWFCVCLRYYFLIIPADWKIFEGLLKKGILIYYISTNELLLKYYSIRCKIKEQLKWTAVCPV